MYNIYFLLNQFANPQWSVKGGTITLWTGQLTQISLKGGRKKNGLFTVRQRNDIEQKGLYLPVQNIPKLAKRQRNSVVSPTPPPLPHLLFCNRLQETLTHRVGFGGRRPGAPWKGQHSPAETENIADSGTKGIPLYREIREKLYKLAIKQNMPFTSC